MFAAAPTASLARFRVKSPHAVRGARNGAARPARDEHQRVVLVHGHDTLRGGGVAVAVGSERPGSAPRTQRRLHLATEFCTRAREERAATRRGGGGDASPRRGGARVRGWAQHETLEASGSVAGDYGGEYVVRGPGDGGVGAVGRGTGGGRGPDLGRGAEDELGAHRESSRRTRQVVARRATVSASAFASATPSALRAVLSCAAGSKTLAAIASSPRGCRGSGGSDQVPSGRCLPRSPARWSTAK